MNPYLKHSIYWFTASVLIIFIATAKADEGYSFPRTCEGFAYEVLADAIADGASRKDLMCVISTCYPEGRKSKVTAGHIGVKRRINGEWKYFWPSGVSHKEDNWPENICDIKRELTFGKCLGRLIWLDVNINK